MAKGNPVVVMLRDKHHGGNIAAPVYRASFTKAFLSSLYAIAISNVVIFDLDTPAFIVGVASALNALAYFCGPLVFHGASRHAGIKQSLQLAGVVDLLAIILVLTIPSPAILVMTFIVDGLASCMFWANMSAAVRGYQDRAHPGIHERIYRRYNTSWIAGGLAGELLGLVITVTGFDDRAGLGACVFIGIAQVFTSNRVDMPARAGDREARDRRVSNAAAMPARNHVRPSTVRTIARALAGPIGLMIVAELAIQMIRGTFDFLYPFILHDDGGSAGWVYLMSLAQRLALLLGIFTSSKQGIKGQLASAMLGLGMVLVLAVQVVHVPGHAMFTAALVLSAFASGLIYGFSSQVLLRCGARGKALQLASVYEATSGLGYAIMVIIAGIGGDGDVRPVFAGLAAFLAVAIIMFVMVSRGEWIIRQWHHAKPFLPDFANPGRQPSTTLLRLVEARISTPHGRAIDLPPLMDTAKK